MFGLNFQRNNMTYEEPNMVYFSKQLAQNVGMQPLIQVRFIVLQIKKVYMVTFFFLRAKTRFGRQGEILQLPLLHTR
jgi:predicted metalloprotease